MDRITLLQRILEIHDSGCYSEARAMRKHNQVGDDEWTAFVTHSFWGERFEVRA